MARYALLVAASDYEDPYFEQLRSPAQDVRGLAEVLRDPAIGDFEVTVLENAADHEIRRKLDELTADRQPDDLVLAYFSCHGLQDVHGRLHFATTTTSAQLPASTAIAASFVSDCLEHTAAAGRLLILDCCYSGAFARGFAKTSPRPLDGEISRGYVCLTACNEYELAYEGESVVIDEPRPSVFTEVVIQGLRSGEADLDRDGWIESGELHRYTYDRVRKITRQTPSYFATGLQSPLRVAHAGAAALARRREPGAPLSEVAMARTPKFFAARFPPFRFAREDRATPTLLAEAMAGRRDEAVALFASAEARTALYEWISQDVRDRNLERSILRRQPADAVEADAAVGTFIATFAPHLAPCYRGAEVCVDDLTKLARTAAEGDSDAQTSISQLHSHNVLRTLATHNCRETAHPCGQGKACQVLTTAAKRWDQLVAAAGLAVQDLPEQVRPQEPAIMAQLLAMVLDEKALDVPLGLAGVQRDMPTWWLRLIVTTRIAVDFPGREDARISQLALAVLTHDAARAERDAARALEDPWQARNQESSEPSAGVPPGATPTARGVYLKRGALAVVIAGGAAAVSVGAGRLIADLWWRDWDAVPGAAHDAAGSTWACAVVGLVLTSMAAAAITTVCRVYRRRWRSARRLALALVALAAGALIVVPAARAGWQAGAHAQLRQDAAGRGIVLDNRYRPIPADCGVRYDPDHNDVVVAPTQTDGKACHAAAVYFQNRRTGSVDMPAEAQWTRESRVWVAAPDLDAVLVVAVWVPAARHWRLLGSTVRYPAEKLWTYDVDRASATADSLRVLRWNDILVFPGKAGIYAINLRTGQSAWHHSCPPGRPYHGLGDVHPDGVGLYCGNRELVVDR